MREGLVRKSLWGAAIGGAAFTGLGLYLNLANGIPVLANLGPLTVLAVVGGTIGGLVGPLFRRRSGTRGGAEEGLEHARPEGS